MQPPLFAWQRAWRVALAAGIATFLVVFAMMPRPALGILPPCTFKNLTGLPCALCGGTRSAQAFLHGDVSSALYLNPLSLAVVVGLSAFALLMLWEALRGHALADWRALPGRIRPWMPLTFILLLLVWWVPHLLSAVKTPKKELLDLRNPIAATLYRHFHKETSP